jgi:acetyl/propionyl-CoA carboxylase alpha subunit
MNTRLQVEHPVTEAVTGLDLVRAQLLVAAGEPLPWDEGNLVQRGHAIECRIYAEDPANDFLPQAGTLAVYREPRGPGIRVDSGVVEGSQVSVYYDPLLSKLVVSAENRDLARRRAIDALRHYPILGIRTNVPFLIRVLESAPFREGRIDTAFLDTEGEALRQEVTRDHLAAALAAVVMAKRGETWDPASAGLPGDTGSTVKRPDPWDRLTDWRF